MREAQVRGNELDSDRCASLATAHNAGDLVGERNRDKLEGLLRQQASRPVRQERVIAPSSSGKGRVSREEHLGDRSVVCSSLCAGACSNRRFSHVAGSVLHAIANAAIHLSTLHHLSAVTIDKSSLMGPDR
jgi:hypothetical protein